MRRMAADDIAFSDGMEVQWHGDTMVIRFTVEELDYDHGNRLKPHLDMLLSRSGGPGRTVVDLTPVSFLYSAGLGLLGMVLRFTKTHQQLPPILVGVVPQARQAIAAVRMEEAFHYKETLKSVLP